MERHYVLKAAPKDRDHPKWEDVQRAVENLDGEHLSEVELELVGQGSLLIEGGDEGRYLTVYFPENRSDVPSLTLTDPTLKGPDVIVTAQTPSEREAKYAVLLPLVLQVAQHFLQTGQVPKDVRWELDNTGEVWNP